MARSIVACRTTSYRPFEALAYEHLAGLGVRYVEIRVPEPQQLAGTRTALERFGLSASSLHGSCDLSRPDVAGQIESQMPAFVELGTPFMLLSVRAAGTPLPQVYDRLRQAGDVAARFRVTLVLETHPDLATNAAVARQTMLAVDHPQVRVNFDTANVYFYNEQVDGVQQLREIIEWVASLHIKDTDGRFRHWHFPALGRGVVDFRAVFEVLDAADFCGPCTIEIEGLEGETPTERTVCDRVAESLGYLRALNRL